MDVAHNWVSIPHPSPSAEDGFRFFSNLLLRSHQKDLAVSEMGSTYNGTDRQKRKISISEILEACGSGQNEKLVDAQCCADMLPYSIPLLSTEVLASGTQRFTHKEQSSFHQLLQVGSCRPVLGCYQPKANTGVLI